ncbi:ROK family protein [Nitriliruptoraceae bacterium ZYF776]|nr:ROK family protein [Profundirhabdus halotolerans]
MELRRGRSAVVLRAARSGVLDGLQHPRHAGPDLPLPRAAGRGGRGPGREAERRTGPHAVGRGRGAHLRLHRREPAHGRGVPPRRAAARERPRRARHQRAAHGELPVRRERRDRRARPGGSHRLRAPGRPGDLGPPQHGPAPAVTAPPTDVEVVVGLDVGGTKVRAGLVDHDGRVRAVTQVPTPRGDGRSLVAELAALAADVAGGAWSQVRRIGVGVPGVVDVATGRTSRCPNLPSLTDVDLAGSLAATTARVVHVDNDGAAAALGEHRFGSGRGVDDLVVVSVGTGVGAGIVSGGRLLRGHGGAAGELADLPLGLVAGAPPGDLESRVGTPGLLERWRGATGAAASGVREVVAAASDGDVRAVGLLDELAEELAATVATVVAVVDPARVVLTGGIGSQPAVADRVAAAVRRRLGGVPDVAVGALGDRAGVVGAAALALADPRPSTAG